MSSFFIDNFDGSGSLAGRTSDTGHGYFGNHKDALVVAGGVLADPDGWAYLGIFPGVTPPSADYAVEMYIETGPTLLTYDLSFSIRDTTDLAGSGGARLEFYGYFSGGNCQFQVNGATGGVYPSGSFRNAAVSINTTYRLGIQASGGAVTAWFKDIGGTDVVAPLTITDVSVQSVGVPKLTHMGDASISRYEAWDVNGLTPDFWTGYRLCTEQAI